MDLPHRLLRGFTLYCKGTWGLLDWCVFACLSLPGDPLKNSLFSALVFWPLAEGPLFYITSWPVGLLTSWFFCLDFQALASNVLGDNINCHYLIIQY